MQSKLIYIPNIYIYIYIARGARSLSRRRLCQLDGDRHQDGRQSVLRQLQCPRQIYERMLHGLGLGPKSTRRTMGRWRVWVCVCRGQGLSEGAGPGRVSEWVSYQVCLGSRGILCVSVWTSVGRGPAAIVTPRLITRLGSRGLSERNV